MDLLFLPMLCSVPFLFASLVRKAAKDLFPTLECCILMAEIMAVYFLLMGLSYRY